MNAMRSLSALVAAAALCLALLGCAAADPAVQSTENAISAIGDVDLSSRDAISAAREAYDGLSDAQREKVENADKLTEAEALWEDEYGAKLSEVVSAISAIGKVTLESEAAISHAESLYNLLSTDEKLLVENRDDLFAARKALSRLEEEAAKPKPFAIGDSADSGKWHVELVDAYTSTEVADANALTSFVSESGTFVVLEFDMLADSGTRDTIDEKVLTDICARWNGQEYKNFDMQYAPGALFMSAKNTIFDWTGTLHLYLFAELPREALGDLVTVDLKVLGENKQAVIQ